MILLLFSLAFVWESHAGPFDGHLRCLDSITRNLKIQNPRFDGTTLLIGDGKAKQFWVATGLGIYRAPIHSDWGADEPESSENHLHATRYRDVMLPKAVVPIHVKINDYVEDQDRSWTLGFSDGKELNLKVKAVDDTKAARKLLVSIIASQIANMGQTFPAAMEIYKRNPTSVTPAQEYLAALKDCLGVKEPVIQQAAQSTKALIETTDVPPVPDDIVIDSDK